MMQTLPANSVQCCVTSPPYYGLRDYGNDGQIGLEDTPEAYIAKMVEVFREVKRVLRDDGTLWLNIGDSYWAGKGSNGSSKARATADERGYAQSSGTVTMDTRPTDGKHDVIKPKDLIGIPWMLAFALRADGWYLRQDIIWHKPNPMPESVVDRCTKAHEYLFLLSKSQHYYFDHEAVKEPLAASSIPRLKQNIESQVGTTRANGGAKTNGNFKAVGDVENGTRNRRSVWSITTKPFKGAHFAVMPEALVEPCVLAGSKAGDTILDPFTGSGTVGVVSLWHGRSFVGTELNPEYVEIAEARILDSTKQQSLFFSSDHYMTEFTKTEDFNG